MCSCIIQLVAKPLGTNIRPLFDSLGCCRILLPHTRSLGIGARGLLDTTVRWIPLALFPRPPSSFPCAKEHNPTPSRSLSNTRLVEQVMPWILPAESVCMPLDHLCFGTYSSAASKLQYIRTTVLQQAPRQLSVGSSSSCTLRSLHRASRLVAVLALLQRDSHWQCQHCRLTSLREVIVPFCSKKKSSYPFHFLMWVCSIYDIQNGIVAYFPCAM